MMLPIVSDSPQPNQDCSRCRHIHKCRSRRTSHGKPLSDRNDMINLLVCRLKLRLRVDESATTLLQLLRPGMVNLVAMAKRRAGGSRIDFDTMLMEMQSFAIEVIVTKYRIGELNPITNFLFDPKNGFLFKWTKWHIAKGARFSSKHVLAGMNPFGDESDNSEYGSSDGDRVDAGSYGHNHAAFDAAQASAADHYARAEESGLAEEVTATIEDGITLNTNEYRTIKFCLTNANDGNDVRMIDGLHIHLARIMNVSRPRVTRLYKRSRDKLVAKIRGNDNDAE